MPDQLTTSLHYTSGFPPILGDNPTILILGSLPGVASINQQQYYAHPQNAFWRMMEVLFQIPGTAPYLERCEQVKTAKLAIWDVCRSAHRPGSLDSAITLDTVIANNINDLLVNNPSIQLIAFNGNAAANLFKRHIQLQRTVNLMVLPSTSPANARLTFEEKLAHWSHLKMFA